MIHISWLYIPASSRSYDLTSYLMTHVLDNLEAAVKMCMEAKDVICKDPSSHGTVDTTASNNHSKGKARKKKVA